jgi:hypothetical protein
VSKNYEITEEVISLKISKKAIIMKLELHPDAIKNFNEKADAILLELAPIPQELSRSPESSFKPDIVAKNIEPKGEVKSGFNDDDGNEIAKIFRHEDRFIGLFGESYKRLRRLAESMQKAKQLSNTVSITLLTDLIFDWMKGKYQNTTSIKMTGYVLGESEKQIKEVEVWLPIALFHIQSEFSIGRITLKPITRNIFDCLRASIKTVNLEQKAKVEKYFDRYQEKLQGLAAATIKLIAEPKRALEVAVEESENSLGVLRFFSITNFSPTRVSYCALLGKENMEGITFLLINDGTFFQLGEENIDQAVHPWILDDQEIAQTKTDGLEILSNLLKQEKRTSFQEDLLSSVVLYSRSSLARNPTDKLVYILVALESLLLRDENEPIQQNIGERLAFSIADKASERKSIIRNVKKVYGLRSSFIHHGQTIDDLDSLKEFMKNAWTFLLHMIHNAHHYASKQQLIERIEDRKFS